MGNIDFQAIAKQVMESPLFRERIGKSAIGWNEKVLGMWLRCRCKCVYCGSSMLESFIVMEFDAQRDHLLPRQSYRELENEPSNWVLACSACNKLKGTWDANRYGGEELYISGTGKLSCEQRKELINRVVKCNSQYSEPTKQTFAKQKEKLLGILAGLPPEDAA